MKEMYVQTRLPGLAQENPAETTPIRVQRPSLGSFLMSGPPESPWQASLPPFS